MGKDKIRKFKENETFRCLIQPPMDEVLHKDHPLLKSSAMITP